MNRTIFRRINPLTLALGLIAAGLLGCAVSPYGHGGPYPYPTQGVATPGQPSQPSRPAFAVLDAIPGAIEELWVIQRPAPAQQPAATNELPGTGALMARVPSEKQDVPIPLKHTDVKASIAGYIATVDVTQQYQNPYNEKIEAIYVFPLPHNAAVNEFVMTVGQRRIRGIIREREEAQRIYHEAKSQGYVASLLTQERPNIFTQAVANIEPGKQIDINIRYFHTLEYADGWYEYVFPMVVGPRFNPPGYSDGVGAVGRGQPGLSGQKTEVQYLKPAERSGHDIALSVQIDAGVPIEQVECRSHQTRTNTGARNTVGGVLPPSPGTPGEGRGGGCVTVTLADSDRIPNKDFVLRYKVAGGQITSGLIVQRDPRNPSGGFFTLMLFPPQDLAAVARKPVEMVFVMDCSGSMSGQPIAQSKAAVRKALQNMQPGDTFQIIRFENGVTQFSNAPVPATPENIRRGLDFVDRQEASGGTMMTEGIRAALSAPADPERLRIVTFLTDGFVGNEPQVLAETHRLLRGSRLFSFGVGSSPNRYLLDGMARLGRGAVAYLALNDNAADVMDRYFQRISHPAMTDISLDFSGMQVSDVYPRQVPDLFVGRPVIITGRFTGNSSAVRVTGRVGNQQRQITVPFSSKEIASHTALPAIWARMKIADICQQTIVDPQSDWPQQVKQTVLEYGLMSPFTAFVAVDSLTRTAGDHGTTVGVPVPVPEGVRYETTVDERK